jgi:4'-phosphopantetheinyl transferase
VAGSGLLGIDVEAISESIEADPLAERHFSSREAEALRSLPPDERAARFYEVWTLKEALLKAVGLDLPLHHFSLEIEGRRIDATLPPLPQEFWTFLLVDVAGTHKLAIAVGRAWPEPPPIGVTVIDASSMAAGGPPRPLTSLGGRTDAGHTEIARGTARAPVGPIG